MVIGMKPARNALGADPLLDRCRYHFEQIPDHRAPGVAISLPDALMAGLALFQLKDPSLLAFEQRADDENFLNVYGITRLPSDTQLRAILDGVEPESLRPTFRALFRAAQRGGALRGMRYLDEGYLLSLDGVEYFSSYNVHCPRCLQRQRRGCDEPEHFHQMYAGVLVHPDRRQVIPLMPEPILRQDGATKNDCERNASIRFLERFRRDHPHLRVVVTADGLSSNGPFIAALRRHRCRFLLGVKDGDHASLLRQVDERARLGALGRRTVVDRATGVRYIFIWANDLYLNESHREVRVHYLRCQEESPDGTTTEFAWVTDIRITSGDVMRLMRAGRARWKIENETFNTLKNQGYHFDHNFGHGEQNLSVIFALLMMLAFTIDQLQELTNSVFQDAIRAAGSRRRLWEQLRALWTSTYVESMQQLYEAIAYGYDKPNLVPNPPNTS